MENLQIMLKGQSRTSITSTESHGFSSVSTVDKTELPDYIGLEFCICSHLCRKKSDEKSVKS